jgi:hypothetical protein
LTLVFTFALCLRVCMCDVTLRLCFLEGEGLLTPQCNFSFATHSEHSINYSFDVYTFVLVIIDLVFFFSMAKNIDILATARSPHMMEEGVDCHP